MRFIHLQRIRIKDVTTLTGNKWHKKDIKNNEENNGLSWFLPSELLIKSSASSFPDFQKYRRETLYFLSFAINYNEAHSSILRDEN